MWFDDLDKKIREAAERHQPSYNEDAWPKMEHKLNKHLPPNQGSRKRYLIWFFLFLLTGSAILLFIHRDGQITSQISTTTATGNQEIYNDNSKQADKMPSADPLLAAPGPVHETNNTSTTRKPEINNIEPNPGHLRKGTMGHKNLSPNITRQNDQLYHTNELFLTDLSSLNDKHWQPATSLPVTTLWEKPGNLQQLFKGSSLWQQPNSSTVLNFSRRQRNLLKSIKNNVSMVLYAGPSISTVSLDDPGKFTPSYGAALRYAINNKFTISAGFLVNDKIYPAAKDDYHPPAGYWTNYTDLLKINAACRVYEIPINISYTISKKQKHEWLATAGISSYLMQRETYDYKYRNNAGQIAYRSWTLNNGGNNNLAVLNLSAGYKYHVNPNIALSIEPMLKLPLKGVGFGKIKIYEAGTMVGLHIKPFGK